MKTYRDSHTEDIIIAKITGNINPDDNAYLILEIENDASVNTLWQHYYDTVSLLAAGNVASQIDGERLWHHIVSALSKTKEKMSVVLSGMTSSTIAMLCDFA
jgi:hypothetical protein